METTESDDESLASTLVHDTDYLSDMPKKVMSEEEVCIRDKLNAEFPPEEYKKKRKFSKSSRNQELANLGMDMQTLKKKEGEAGDHQRGVDVDRGCGAHPHLQPD